MSMHASDAININNRMSSKTETLLKHCIFALISSPGTQCIIQCIMNQSLDLRKVNTLLSSFFVGIKIKEIHLAFRVCYISFVNENLKASSRSIVIIYEWSLMQLSTIHVYKG